MLSDISPSIPDISQYYSNLSQYIMYVLHILVFSSFRECKLAANRLTHFPLEVVNLNFPSHSIAWVIRNNL